MYLRGLGHLLLLSGSYPILNIAAALEIWRHLETLLKVNEWQMGRKNTWLPAPSLRFPGCGGENTGSTKTRKRWMLQGGDRSDEPVPPESSFVRNNSFIKRDCIVD